MHRGFFRELRTQAVETADIYGRVATDRCRVESALQRPQTLLIAIGAILSFPFSSSPLIIYPLGTCISVNNTEEKSMKTLS